MEYNIYFLTLGCSKNDIDTECMMSLLNQKYKIVDDITIANIVVVNTCSFILDAKEQSVDTIMELINLKGEVLKYIVVAGCLGQRYPDDLMKDIPEIDAIIGTGQLSNINNILDDMIEGKRCAYTSNVNDPYPEDSKRVDFKRSQYIKISEGCNNHCSYCIIPKLRGKMRSRSIEDIVREAEYLSQNGTRELILIAQNTTEYGKDNYGRPMLDKLLIELNKIRNLTWIRVLYMYPEGFYPELIDAIKKCEKVVNYVDMPLQHISDPVLKSMNRHSTKESVLKLIDDLRKEIPDIIIRSTFIVGFATESEGDYNELIDFIKEYKLDRVGVFCYSLEEGTRAYKWGSPISEEIKEQRRDRLMSIQADISYNKLKERAGSTMMALIEDYQDGKYIGRTYMDSPGVDGTVIIDSENPLKIGEFYDIVITGADYYDLEGKEVGIHEFTKQNYSR